MRYRDVSQARNTEASHLTRQRIDDCFSLYSLLHTHFRYVPHYSSQAVTERQANEKIVVELKNRPHLEEDEDHERIR